MNEYIEPVAAYIRVSTQEQKLHGFSLAAQREKLQSYADSHNMRIVAWYEDEGVSGRKLIKKRPALMRMAEDAPAGNFARIIFIKLDRFFRSVGEYYEYMKLIKPVTWTATEEKYDTATASGRAFVNMKLTVAEMEADQTGERIKLVNDYRVKNNLPVVPERCLPFGFGIDKGSSKETRRVVHRDEEAMRDLLTYALQHGSVHGAMNYINGRYGLGLSYKRVTTALRSELLMGKLRENYNYCEPYLTPEEFDRLQTAITGTPRETPSRVYLFAGLLVCPECGRRLAGNQHGSIRRGKRYVYSVYRCPQHRADGTCKNSRIIMERTLERGLIAELENILDGQIAEIRSAENAKAAPGVDIDALRAELDRLNYSWQKGRIKDAADYDRRYDEIAARIAEAEAARAAAPVSAPNLEKIRAELSGGWTAIYAALDDEHKRAFWRSFIKAIHLHPDQARKNKIVRVEFF